MTPAATGVGFDSLSLRTFIGEVAEWFIAPDLGSGGRQGVEPAATREFESRPPRIPINAFGVEGFQGETTDSLAYVRQIDTFHALLLS